MPNPSSPEFRGLFDRVIEDIKSQPEIVVISLHGSLLSGEQDEFSDVDLDTLVWRKWDDLERTAESRLWSLHVDCFLVKTNIGRKDTPTAALSACKLFEEASHLSFAPNRRWHPGPKRFMRSLAELKVLPPDFAPLAGKRLDSAVSRPWDELKQGLDGLVLRHFYHPHCNHKPAIRLASC